MFNWYFLVISRIGNKIVNDRVISCIVDGSKTMIIINDF